MKATGTKAETIRAWADVVIKMWEEKILQLDVWDEGELYESFVTHVLNSSGGDVSKIDFLFNLYGVYADMGVGRETSKGNSGDIKKYTSFNPKTQSFDIQRKAKPWYSRVWFREVMKLFEYTAWREGKEAANMILEKYSEAFDQRATKNPKTVTNLRTVRYREKNNARWSKNYKEYGFESWKSRNKH